MIKRVVVALSLMSFAAGISASANEAPAAKKKHHKHRQHKVVVEPPKITYGNMTIDKIYNHAHHRVLFVNAQGKRTFIAPGQSRLVATLFQVTECTPVAEITTEDLEKKYSLVSKGDHSYVFRLTPEGFSVHRMKDAGALTKGRILLSPYTKDVVRDLLIEHVAGNTGKRKTSAFSLVESGVMVQKDVQPKRAASGSFLGKK